jgi:flagellar hook-associated protein 1 FlgK
MPGLSAGLNIGLSGLQASQAALDVIGHNIANINTPGYSRQQVVLSTSTSQAFGDLQFGTGVNVTSILGVRDKFLDMQITQSISTQSGAQTRYQGVQAVASAFQDDGTTGLNTQIQNFFSGLQQLSARPEDGSLRTNLVGTAQSMVTAFKSRYQMLTDQATSADHQVSTLVTQVNTLTKQIASLNDRIATETTAGSDNDARDQRKALADQLAGIVGIQVFEDDKSRLQITLDSGAAVLVNGSTAATMTATPDNALGGNLRVDVTLGGASAPTDVTKGIKGGTLGGNLDLRDNILPGYMNQLDSIAAGITGKVNLQHREGYALDGTTTTIDFFQGGTIGSPLSNDFMGLPSSLGGNVKGMVNLMQVNAAIVASPDLIAASGITGAVGDNSNAAAMAKIETGTSQFSTAVGSLANTVGTQAQGYTTDATNQENLTGALQTQRNRVSSVDLDEEAAQLLSFQRGYQASARFINVISQLTDQLVNGLGK